MKLNNNSKDMILQLIEEVCLEDKTEFYKSNNADPFIIKILELYKELNNPKKWGVFLENVAEKVLGLSPSTNSEHDKTYNGKEIEIKSSTLNKRLHYQYNSVRITYKYDYLLLQNIGFNEIKYYIISKEELIKIKDIWKGQKTLSKGLITMINFLSIEKYVTEIKTKEDLDKLIKK